MRHRIARLAVGSLSAVLVASCAGNGQGLDSNGRPLDSGGPTDTPLTADFQSIQDHVFTPICSVCHAGGGAPQGLRLDAQNSYAMLVGVPSTEVPSILRIKPGDPDGSYLVQKIEGRAAVGAQMPFGGPALPSSTIAVIRQWVSDGALPPTTVASQKPFAVSMSVPASGDVMPLAPAQLTVGFTHELDQTRVDSTTLRLERLGPMPVGQVIQVIPVHLVVPPANPQVVLLTPESPLVTGRYRIVAVGGVGPELSDISGQSLVGPADDGAGNHVLSEFEVEAMP